MSRIIEYRTRAILGCSGTWKTGLPFATNATPKNQPRSEMFVRQPDVDVLQNDGNRLLCEVWKNELYEVYLHHRADGGITLSISRHDNLPIHWWIDFQEIKNELVGAERWAVELYPPQSQLIDESNTYHLHVQPESKPFCGWRKS
jgi:hypothetical protein